MRGRVDLDQDAGKRHVIGSRGALDGAGEPTHGRAPRRTACLNQFSSGWPSGRAVGIVGAVIAGWLLPRIGFVLIGGIGAAILNAVIGAVILLLIIGFFQRKTA